MHVVNNINKFTSNKRSMTTVSIEEVDESWALNLLNESQIEDEPITVQTQKLEKTVRQYDNYLNSALPEADSLIDELIEANNKTYVKENDMVLNSLSAIEAQKIAFLEKQKVEELQEIPEQTSKQKPNSILTRIKGIFSL